MTEENKTHYDKMTEVVMTIDLQETEHEASSGSSFFPVTEREDGVAATLKLTRNDLQNIACAWRWLEKNSYGESILLTLDKDKVDLTYGSTWANNSKPGGWHISVGRESFITLTGYNKYANWERLGWVIPIDRDAVEGFAYAGTDPRYENVRKKALELIGMSASQVDISKVMAKSLQETLSIAPWPFARKEVEMNVPEDFKETLGVLPDDCLKLLEVVDTEGGELPWTIRGRQLFVEWHPSKDRKAIVRYVSHVKDARLFTEEFNEALAVRVAMNYLGTYGLGPKLKDMYDSLHEEFGKQYAEISKKYAK